MKRLNRISFICACLCASVALAAPTTQEWLQSTADSAPAGLASIRAVFSGGAEFIATPTPATQPSTPDWMAGKKIVRVSLTTIDQYDFNATPNTVYVFPTGFTYLANRTRTVNKVGVHLIGEGLTPGATIDVAGAKWKQPFLTFTDTAKDCGVHNLIITGHDGASFVQLEGAERFTYEYIDEKLHPVHRGGITHISANGSKFPVIRHVTSEGNGRYSIWFGDSLRRGNIGGNMEDCQLGPIKMLESEKSSGADKDTGSLNGGAKYEHPFRIYGGIDWKISRCTFTNPHTAKNSLKIMSGDGFTVTDCVMDGVSRFGRDVNDPPGQRLANCALSRCTFTDLVRIDPGADVTLTDDTLSKLQVEKRGRVKLVNCKVAGVVTNGVVSR